MKINKEVLRIAKEEYDNPFELIGYLFVLFTEEKAEGNFLQQRAIELGIIRIVNGEIEFLIPLIAKEEEIDKVWLWVKTEYLQMFVEQGKQGIFKESLSRMKKFFSENPDVRKDEVIGATQLYIKNTDRKFIRQPHYFISKGVGYEKISDLLLWVEKYRELHKEEDEERHLTRVLQS